MRNSREIPVYLPETQKQTAFPVSDFRHHAETQNLPIRLSGVWSLQRQERIDEITLRQNDRIPLRRPIVRAMPRSP